jgi:hypothetical protein
MEGHEVMVLTTVYEYFSGRGVGDRENDCVLH